MMVNNNDGDNDGNNDGTPTTVPLNILICDDSGMARKQMARALPAGLAGQVFFSENGLEALKTLGTETIDLLFLDLTMPVMDGFETLEQIRLHQIDCMVIVVSGDIQPEARKRVMELGALAFLSKPVAPDTLLPLLHSYGLLDTGTADDTGTAAEAAVATAIAASAPTSADDCLREVANIAMGQAADKLARLFNAFIHLPIPQVATLTSGELGMALAGLSGSHQLTVSQGFVARGLLGEAILSIDADSIENFRQLIQHQNANNLADTNGPILDAATILTGAFVNGLGKLLDLTFSKSQPVILTLENQSAQTRNAANCLMENTLAIEIPYRFDNPAIVCDLLLLFPGANADYIRSRASLLIEEN